MERRPIAARKLPIVIKTASALARMGASPNGISVVGMLACTLAGIMLWGTAHLSDHARWLYVGAAALVQFRLLCNMLDGMVAIESGRQSRVGELYNEVPDRISDAVTLIGLGYAANSSPVLGVLAALLAIMTAYIRSMSAVAGAPQDYRGPMAKQQRMALVTLLCVFLALAPAEWAGRVAFGSWSITEITLAVLSLGCLITCARRLSRAYAILMTGAAAHKRQ
jgi:phosphatidylglycerophosphate synthase